MNSYKILTISAVVAILLAAILLSLPSSSSFFLVASNHNNIAMPKTTAEKNSIVAMNPEGEEQQHILGQRKELTINDVRQSRLLLLKGIDNTIQKLKESQPSTTPGGGSFNINTTHIAQLLKTDQLQEAIVELNKLRAEVVKAFGQEAANKQVVPQIQNLISALEKQQPSPPPL
jgi:hypothetical protein